MCTNALNNAKQVDYAAASVLARETEAGLKIAEGTDTFHTDVLLIYREKGARSFVNLHNIVERLQHHCRLRGWACNAQAATGTFQEQHALFRGTRTLVAAHGASLSNVIWMRQGAAVVR